jgi:HEAT repeat protein
MSTRRKVTLVTLFSLTVAGAWFLVTRSSEPEYRGRKLSSWLTEADHWSGDTNAPVVLAVRAIGKNAVPYLVKECFVQDSGIKEKVAVELEKHPKLLEHRFTTAPERWARAKWALGILGSDARSGLPAFLAALTNESAMVRALAVNAMGAMGPEAEDCVPALIARERDQSVRGNVMYALGSIGRRADSCVPVLRNALGDTNVIVRQNAVSALGNFGDEAKVCVPELTKALNDKFTARRAANALRRIQSDDVQR